MPSKFIYLSIQQILNAGLLAFYLFNKVMKGPQLCSVPFGFYPFLSSIKTRATAGWGQMLYTRRRGCCRISCQADPRPQTSHFLLQSHIVQRNLPELLGTLWASGCRKEQRKQRQVNFFVVNRPWHWSILLFTHTGSEVRMLHSTHTYRSVH